MIQWYCDTLAPDVSFDDLLKEAESIPAGIGARAWTDVASACKTCVKTTGSTLPDPTQMDVYRKSYVVYQELYPALKG